jgi:asparagine synthase (glutamine-hydrolysing)
MFSGSEIKNLLMDSSAVDFSILDMNSTLARKLSPAEFQALFDIEFYLKDDLLTKVDRASMKYSLEARVPILDHTVVEFSLNLDPKLKVKDGVAKYLLKQVLFDHVPKELFDRPKWGFSIPLDKWLKNELSYLVDEYLNEKSVNEVGILKWSEVKSLLAKWRSGQNHLYNRVWLMILLQQWLIYTRPQVHTA